MKLKNYNELAKSEIRKMALQIAESGLQSIDTATAIRMAVSLSGDELKVNGQIFPLAKVRRLAVAGVGKCTIDAAAALEEILGDHLFGGVVIDVRECESGKLKKIKPFQGFHPMPQQENIDSTKELVKLLESLQKDDLVLMIISGGGSTLLCSPEDLTCHDEGVILQELFRVGANIKEINTVRKHISYARGGHLAKYAYPATLIGLVFSDVVGDDLQFIASGPTVRDTTTIEEAEQILQNYRILQRAGIRHCAMIETPKEEKYFRNVHNFLVVSNTVALTAMEKKAREFGLTAQICDRCLSGEASNVGSMLLTALQSVPAKTAMLYGGETTVTVKGKGMGGRNQELALSCVTKVEGDELVLSINTDGRDNTDHAGAICDIMTREEAERQQLNPEEFLENNDSYNFFLKVGDFLETGDTGSNVSDLLIAIKF